MTQGYGAPPREDSATGAGEDGEADAYNGLAEQALLFALDAYELGRTPEGATFAVPRDGPQLVTMLHSGTPGTGLSDRLKLEFWRRRGRVIPVNAITAALSTVDALAASGAPTDLAMRVAAHAGSLYVDLGDLTGRAIRVRAGGWTLVDRPPVLFRRTALTAALPEPVPGGSLDELWDYVNVRADDRPLVLAWLVAALLPRIPHPIAALTGEQGTGKSTASRCLVSIIDPATAAVRRAPDKEETWSTAVAGSWVVALDNLSTLPPWLSDALCRAVTGDADVRRRLYSNSDLEVVHYRRVLIMNGIGWGNIPADLEERTIVFELAVIPPDQRREEADFWAAWARAHPRILGALLDLTAGVLAQRDQVRLARLPRMADFGRVVATVDHILGTDGLGHYWQQAERMSVESVAGDPFIDALLATLVAAGGDWAGTATELRTAMLTTLGDPPPRWMPGKGKSMSTRVAREAKRLRDIGWTVTDDAGRNEAGTKRYSLTVPAGDRRP